MSQGSALQIPRFPVLGWHTFGGHGRASGAAVVDGGRTVYTSSGQAAIGLALAALGIGPRDAVLVPTYHCLTMIAPVADCGARPLFFPITDEGMPDLAFLEKAPLQDVRAMIAAHYFGLPRSMAEVRKFCAARGIALIEDCAHAFFGMAGGAPVGSWGDLAVASLTKFFPVPEGGCLVARDPALRLPCPAARSFASELRALWDCLEAGSRYGRLTGLNGALRTLRRLARGQRPPLPAATEAAAHERPGPAAPAGAATGVVRWVSQHARRDRIIENRRSNYALYARLIAPLSGCRALFPVLPPHAVPYVFPLHADRPDPLYAALRAAAAPVARWDFRWPGTPEPAGDRGGPWSRQVLQLGCHQDMSEADVRAVVDIVRTHTDGTDR